MKVKTCTKEESFGMKHIPFFPKFRSRVWRCEALPYTMPYKHKQCKFHLSLPMNLTAALEGRHEFILISMKPGIRHPTRIILMVFFSIS